MMQAPKAKDSSTETLTVSQLNRQVKRLLEGHYDFIWIEGELSNLAQPGSGHWYFTLKDDNAQVRCAMFRTRNQRVRISPKNGQQVRIRARVSLYEGRGEFQLLAEHMEDAGAGALQRAFDELKAKLLAEGLFAAERKQPLPEFPRHIALISSRSGAAVRDIITVFKRRFPAIELSLFPVTVQGSEAAVSVCRAIESANQRGGFDALVVARGGGSAEDLWAFNDEKLARCIAASNIPVLSAVGHEVDFTISDFVADVRAATPSAAAELLSPDAAELAARLRTIEYNLLRHSRRRLQQFATELGALRRQLRHPGDKLREQAQRLDDYELRLQRAISSLIRQRQQGLVLAGSRLRNQSPATALQNLRIRITYLAQRADRVLNTAIHNSAHALALASGRLNSLSPLATLDRGYAIVVDTEGRVLTDAGQVKAGDLIDTRLASGQLRSKVLEASDDK
ncbi:MAG: exodeoxyribonuclease VII large subunit [Halieaceae bacterium]